MFITHIYYTNLGNCVKFQFTRTPSTLRASYSASMPSTSCVWCASTPQNLFKLFKRFTRAAGFLLVMEEKFAKF